MSYIKSAIVLLAVLFTACTTAGDGDWVSTDHDDVMVRTKRTDAGLVSELHSIATGDLIASMTVTGATGSYQDRDGNVHALSNDVPMTDFDGDGVPHFTAIQELPTDEVTANDWLYTLSLEGVKSDHANSKAMCFAAGECGWCCQGDICCWACPGGWQGCGRIIP